MIESEIKEFNGVPEFYDWLIEQDAETTKIFTIKAEVHKLKVDGMEECNYDGGEHIFENGVCKLCGYKLKIQEK